MLLISLKSDIRACELLKHVSNKATLSVTAAIHLMYTCMTFDLHLYAFMIMINN